MVACSRLWKVMSVAFIVVPTLALVLNVGFAQELEDDPSVQPSSSLQPESGPGTARLDRDDKGHYVVKGSVQTIEMAITTEKDSVNWYAWYMGARDYIVRRGGLKCLPGTQLTFSRNGNVKADTLDPRCLLSIDGMNYPLPEKTKLDAVILPVRSRALPPAPPSEIYHRTGGFQ